MQDKRWLGEAVINVLDNAVKYSPCGSKIFIRLQKRNDFVRMEIEGQGIGIPQNEYHKIFQRFYRGSSKEVMEKSGTGIGLCLLYTSILLFAILNCFTTYVFYEDYKYKMNLMTEIAAKEEFSGLDVYKRQVLRAHWKKKTIQEPYNGECLKEVEGLVETIRSADYRGKKKRFCKNGN